MAQDAALHATKGFKVTNGSRERLIGVACSSLEDLKKKGCAKLQVILLYVIVL